jgi:dolichyl-phosphate-mannose--protein O-mannosyl transferase
MIFLSFIIFALLTISHCAEEVKTVNCGSAIRLFHGENPSFYLSSGPYRWTTGSNHQVVTLTQELSSPSSLWQIPSSSHCETGNPVNCGDTIRLMEIETKKFLHTDSTFPSVLSRRDQEISAFGDDDGESKSPENNDWKVVCTGTSWTVDQRVQLYHISSETYLMWVTFLYLRLPWLFSYSVVLHTSCSHIL